MQYTDSSLLGKRSYELRETTLWARGTNHLNQDFEVELPYTDFKPEYARLWVRSNNWIVGGVLLSTLAGIGYQILSEPPVKTTWVGFMIGLIFVGIFSCWSEHKKSSWCVFTQPTEAFCWMW